MEKKKLMIIDGSSLIHRAFYALPLLNTKEGIYTNGVYGFLTMLYRVLEDKNPDYLCVAFDMKGPTFRHEEYDKYKANRSATPSELAQQFPLIRQILKAMNINYLETAGFEADDIAGTLARIGEEKSMDVILVTGDKDYLQLATDQTKVLITRRGITDLEEFDRNTIIEQYGISPQQLIDLKGLMGDQSDNIPGVPGIGEKTGLKLLKEYETIEKIYENIDNISGKKLKENLIDNKEIAFLSRKLGEIIRTVPLDYEVEDFKLVEPEWEELRKLYEKLEFNSLLSKVNNGLKEEEKEEVDYSYYDQDNYDDLVTSIRQAGSFVFKFLISDGNYMEDDIIRLAIKLGDNPTKILKLDSNIDEFSAAFKPIFQDEKIEKIGHNLKNDIIILFRLGINIKNYTFDSMICQYLINPSLSSYSINQISEDYLNYYGIDEEELLGKGKSRKKFSQLDDGEVGQYLGFILETVVEVKSEMLRLLEVQEMLDLYNQVELPLVQVLASMEYYGFQINRQELLDLGLELDKEIETLTREIYDLGEIEFNINSPKQLGEVLFDKLSLPVIKKTKTGYSTNAEVLDKLKDQHPIIDKILRYRQIAKLKSTYIDGMLNLINEDTNRIHSSFNQTITTTGRISSTEPNLQNIPIRTEDGRKIRKAFVAREDYLLVDADYSQIELRVLAHISKDPKLIEAFTKDIDIHSKTASEVFNLPLDQVTPYMRGSAKAVNFGIIYGISDFGLARDLNISRKEAKEYIDNYLINYKLVKEYMDSIVEEGKEKGYVETILHRRRYVPELKAKNFNIKSFGERIAMNTPIQGSAADIIKVAMVKVYNELEKRDLKSRLILQIHDELIIETHREEVEEVRTILKDLMEGAVSLEVPLIAEIEMGDSWYDTE